MPEHIDPDAPNALDDLTFPLTRSVQRVQSGEPLAAVQPPSLAMVSAIAKVTDEARARYGIKPQARKVLVELDEDEAIALCNNLDLDVVTDDPFDRGVRKLRRATGWPECLDEPPTDQEYAAHLAAMDREGRARDERYGHDR